MEENRERFQLKTLEKIGAARKVPKDSMMRLRVILLDDSEQIFEVEQWLLGIEFHNKVCGHLKLLEKEYFGLEFRHHNGSYVWLELLKPLVKQLKKTSNQTLRFIVKFFPPDPGQLQKSLTRYLFTLQIKQDLSNGSLTCNDNSAAILVSHILQSELGDYDEELDVRHLENKQYVPNQEYLDHKIIRFHKKHRGQTPEESDIQLLDVARKLDMYGIRPYAAHDGEGMRLSLAVTHMGVLVFRANTKINTFSWAKIRKLSFKRKHFLIKIHAQIIPSSRETVEFTMVSRDVCKAFWRMCVEYHTFFRLAEEPQVTHRSFLSSKGSSFRYSGRTQKQLLDCMRKEDKTNLPFERKCYKAQFDTRHSRSSPDLLTDVSKQLYNQTCTYPCSSQALGLESQNRAHPPLGELRSKSAVEFLFTTELGQSHLHTPQKVAYAHLHFGSSDREVGLERHNQAERRHRSTERLRAHSLGGTQQLVLLYPNDPHRRVHRVLPTFPLDGHAYTPEQYSDTFPDPQISLLDKVTQSSTFSTATSLSPRQRKQVTESWLRPLGDSVRDVYSGSLSFRRVETDHYNDVSSYQASLPRRAWSQADVKLQGPTAACQASEFRPLGHYPHLSQCHSSTRPTYFPLRSNPLSERPASLCVLGAGSFSDPDSDLVNPYYCPTLGMLVSTAPLARMRTSSGSLQLDEEEEDEGEDLFKLGDADGTKSQ